MSSRLLLLLVFSLASSALFGQSTPPPPEAEPTIQSLLDKIQQMEKRINELEAHERSQATAQAASTGQTVAESKPAPPAEQPAPPSSEHMHHADVREAEAHYPSLQIRGFGDVDFSATDQHLQESNSGFSLGQFVLHLTSPLSKKVAYFGEISFTAQPGVYDLQVERTIIRYDYNDYFKMSFGKYHTPVGYWNTAYHHGAWLQTTISRPEMIKFGGSLIPAHFAGLQAEGNIPSGGVGLGYNVGVGNGRSTVLSKAGDNSDINNNRAWVASLFARPSRFYGFQVGGAVYHDKLSPLPGRDFDEWIASADVVWTKEHPEFLAEFANVQHHDVLTSQIFNTQAFYIQLAYRLPWQENKWKPYYRFEYIHRPDNEPVWDTITGTSSVVVDLVGSTLGVRYDITNYAAFKGEYRSTRHGLGEPRVNGAFFQTAFTF